MTETLGMSALLLKAAAEIGSVEAEYTTDLSDLNRSIERIRDAVIYLVAAEQAKHDIKWTPIKEKKPKRDRFVLIKYENGLVSEGIFRSGTAYSDAIRLKDRSPVIAWAPIDRNQL